MKNPIQIFKSIFKLDDSPEIIAKGFALGSFIGMIPIPGFQVFVAFGVSKLFKVNTKAACIAVFNTNLFTGAFIFAFNYWLGKTVLGISSTFKVPKTINMHFFNTLFKAGSDVYISLIVGGVITGAFFAFVAYHILKRFIKNRQLKNKDL